MKNNNLPKNRFCSIPPTKFRKWDEIDAILWRVGKNDAQGFSGDFYLNAYKDTYVQYNRDKIIHYANAAGIRPDLLAGVAWIESGGMPENFKFQVFEVKRMIPWLRKPVEKTSFGSVATQIRVAAVTLGLDPSELTTRDQLDLATCLMEDDFNLQVSANYLRDNFLYDYPDSPSLYMTDEQYMMVGIRYNRGVQRSRDDFLKIIKRAPMKGTDDYNFISYGVRLLEIRPHIRLLLQE